MATLTGSWSGTWSMKWNNTAHRGWAQKVTRFKPIAVASCFCRPSVLMNSFTARTFAVAQCRTSSERQPIVPLCCSASLTASVKASFH